MPLPVQRVATRKRVGSGMPLAALIRAIEQLAPPACAEEWDNIGLLMAPTGSRRIHRLLLTIDCTPAVVEEAIRAKIDLIVAYHPPLFTPVQTLSPADPLARRLLRLMEERIAVYSPHTALDHAADGVNDWLANGILGDDGGRVETDPTSCTRVVRFKKALSAKQLGQRVKSHLRIPYTRVALPDKPRKIASVAVCAGAGMAALESVRADAYVTGEMKHHDVLNAVARGTTVILSEHTHTERGYLPILRKRLSKVTGGCVDIRVARADRDPIRLGVALRAATAAKRHPPSQCLWRGRLAAHLR